MAGKQHKREAKRAREAARDQQRRRERQRTIQTAIVVLIAVVIGAALIYVSIGDPAEELASEDLSEPESGTAQAEPAVDPCVPEPPPSPAPKLPKPTYSEPEQVVEDGMNYRAIVETSCGRLVVQLFEDDAPQTVNSFVFLAQQGFFDGLEIFRNATSISALQTGAGDNQNTWDIGYTLPDELSRAQAFGGYPLGALAMANKGEPDTGGSQFFMVYGETPLPPEYTLFAQIVEGLDVLQAIGAIPTQAPDDPTNDAPGQTVVLEAVTIEATPGEPLGPLAEVETATATTPTEEGS